MKKFRFNYIEEAVHEAVVEADTLEDAKDKLENNITEKDVIVDREFDYRDTELIEWWE